MKKLYKTMTIRHEGMSITSPNTVLEPEQGNFYISYNDRDTAAYGDVTTALVIDSNKFLILNGDHRSAYVALVQIGLDACLGYFRKNIHLINKHSEQPDTKLDTPLTSGEK